MRDIVYPPVIVTAKVLFKALGLRFQLSGTEHIPREGGALLSINHVGYIDFVLAGFAAQPVHRLVRFMAKREAFDHRVSGPIMRSMHHISVDRDDGIGSFKEAVRYLKEGELVGIFPEATISRSFEIKEIKSGAVRIAAAAGVPVIPVVLWGTQRLMTKDHDRDLSRGTAITVSVGAPVPLSGDAVADTAALRTAMSGLLDDAIRSYPQHEPGAWWLPASYGGSAPTLEEAARIDAEEKAARAARKAAREGA